MVSNSKKMSTTDNPPKVIDVLSKKIYALKENRV